jgi:HEPN domain-containing protein
MRERLVNDYLKRAEFRLEILEGYKEKTDYPDVVEEGQETIELMLNALVMGCGLEVPKIHDVGRYISENLELFPDNIRKNIKQIVRISREARKERDFSFYGMEDWIPLDEYSLEDAEKIINDTKFIKDSVFMAIGK